MRYGSGLAVHAPSLRPVAVGVRAGGFTLLEILVVLMLVSFIMLGLSSSLYSLAQTETRVDQRLDYDNEIRTGMAFLDQTLGRVSTRKRPGVLTDKDNLAWFAGEQQMVQWVGIMPARYGAGGRYFFRLQVENVEGEGAALVVRFSPWASQPGFPDPAEMDSRVLIHSVTDFKLGYRGESYETIAWSPAWSEVDHMPSHISLSVTTATMELPVKIIPMRRANGGINDDVFTIGGS